MQTKQHKETFNEIFNLNIRERQTEKERETYIHHKIIDLLEVNATGIMFGK